MATSKAVRTPKTPHRNTSWNFQFLQWFAVAVLFVLLMKILFGPLSTSLHSMNLPAPIDLQDKIMEMAPQLPQFGVIPPARMREIYQGGARFITEDAITVIGIKEGQPELESLVGEFVTTGKQLEVDDDTTLFEIQQTNNMGVFYYWTTWSQLKQLE